MKSLNEVREETTSTYCWRVHDSNRAAVQRRNPPRRAVPSDLVKCRLDRQRSHHGRSRPRRGCEFYAHECIS